MHERDEPDRQSTPPPPYSPERPPPPYTKTKLEDVNDEKKEENEKYRHTAQSPCTPFSGGSVTATIYPRPASPPTIIVSTSEGINPASGSFNCLLNHC